MFGYSADITCNNNKKLFDILAKQNKFDQLIYIIQEITILI